MSATQSESFSTLVALLIHNLKDGIDIPLKLLYKMIFLDKVGPVELAYLGNALDNSKLEYYLVNGLDHKDKAAFMHMSKYSKKFFVKSARLANKWEPLKIETTNIDEHHVPCHDKPYSIFGE